MSARAATKGAPRPSTPPRLPRFGRFARKTRLASLLATCLLLLAILLPGRDVPELDIPGLDKLIHLLMFGGWTLAILFDFRGLARWKPAFLALGALIGLGTEMMQLFVEGRSFDLRDLAFDVLGIALALYLGKAPLALADAILGGGEGGRPEAAAEKPGQALVPEER